MDTYVLEANVHFPTDMNLLWDACKRGRSVEWRGWRKGKYWRRELKKLMRISAKASGIGGKNKKEIEKEHVRSYLELSRSLSGKIGASLLAIYERALTTNQVEMHAEKIGVLEYFPGRLKNR